MTAPPSQQAATGPGGRPTSRTSVQLYTVREQLAEDLPGTLARLAALGFTQVEPYAFTSFGDALRRGLDDAGLWAPTTHENFVGRSDAELDETFAAAAALDVVTVIEPHVPAARWGSRADVESVADDLGAAAAIAARHGVRVGYHNHAHELESVLDGTSALEVLARRLDEAVVLEVDTYWVTVGGLDPVALLGRLGDRVSALHVKDGPGTADTKEQVAVGSGSLPVRAIIEAAPDALRVIELDDSRGDRFTAIADSLAWLEKENLA